MENVREVMAEVGHWVTVGGVLGVSDSKQQEIKQQSSTEREKSLALGDYWVNTDPVASWEKLTRVLYQVGEERAVAVTKQYLQQQQGEYTQLPVMKVPVKILVQCTSPASHPIVFIQTQGVCDHMYMCVRPLFPTTSFGFSCHCFKANTDGTPYSLPPFVSAHINFQYPEIILLKHSVHGQEQPPYQNEIMMVFYTFNP